LLVFPAFCDKIPVMTLLYEKIAMLPPSLLPMVEHFVDTLPKTDGSWDDLDLKDTFVMHNKDLVAASLSSMDFWDNAIDDEVWNDV